MSEYHDPSNIVNPEHSDHHIVTPLQYSMVFAALLVGTALTVIAAKIDLLKDIVKRKTRVRAHARTLHRVANCGGAGVGQRQWAQEILVGLPLRFMKRDDSARTKRCSQGTNNRNGIGNKLQNEAAHRGVELFSALKLRDVRL